MLGFGEGRDYLGQAREWSCIKLIIKNKSNHIYGQNKRVWGMGHRVYHALHLTPYTLFNYLINSTVLFRNTVPFSFVPFM